MRYLFEACRPKQWTKNLLVFSAPLFSFKIDPQIWHSSFISLISFCLISSSIYLFNDLIDVDSDRKHPVKKRRPLAAGKISPSTSLISSLILTFLGFYLALKVSVILAILIFLYILIQVSYNLKLKKVPILDIFCISSGFLIRAISGGVAANLFISQWFLLTIGLLALFLSIEKRKEELRFSNSKGFLSRTVLKKYSLELLQRMENIVSASTFICYSLWAVDYANNEEKSVWMLITIPIVLYGIFRYQIISDPKESERRRELNINLSTERPEEVLINDMGIKISILCWLLVILLFGYLF
tara:strand:+ start:124 stop:1020 length:897 start_codon:yes stop_codon:yes gene_type:complete